MGSRENIKLELKRCLWQMYPILREAGINLNIEWDQSLKVWIVSVGKKGHVRYAVLHEEDALSCLNGKACIYLGVAFIHFAHFFESIA